MYPDQTVPREQSDLGPFCLQYRIHRRMRKADNIRCDWRRPPDKSA